MDKVYKRLMPMRMRIVELVEDEYDRQAKEAVIAAVKDKCNKDIKINSMVDFTNALNDLRMSGYMIKYVMSPTTQKGEFKTYKIDGGMVL